MQKFWLWAIAPKVVVILGITLALGGLVGGFVYTVTTPIPEPNPPLNSNSASVSHSASKSSSSTTTTASDGACGNAVGNGNEIVAGPAGPTESDYDQPFRSLTVDPKEANTIVVGTERNGFLKSRDGGNTWRRLRQGLRHENVGYPEIWDLAIAHSSPNTLFAATLDSPGPVTEMGGIYKSSDGGLTWSRQNCGLLSSRITSVIFNTSNSQMAVAGVEGGASTHSETQGRYFPGGLYYTSDGGSNWHKANVPGEYTKNGYWNLYLRSGTYYTFGFNYDNRAENVGFLKSVDDGQTWSAFGSELRNLLITNFDVSADGQTIYANARDSFQIKKSTDGGGSWTTVPNQANGPLAVSPANAQIVIFAGNNTLFRTTDGLVNSGSVLKSANQFQDVAFAPSSPSIVYAITRGYLLYKSTDAGASWTLMKNLRQDVLKNKF